MKTPLPSSQILLKSILFATDFSAASMRALPYATDTATQYGARLYVAHVMPIESYLLGDSQAVERLRLARQEAESSLADIVRSPSVARISGTPLLDNGDVWAVLRGFIEQYSVDLLVVGTTGRTGLPLMGTLPIALGVGQGLGISPSTGSRRGGRLALLAVDDPLHYTRRLDLS